VFSPTVASDEKWDWVKSQKLLADNIPLKKWMENMTSDDNPVVEGPTLQLDLPKYEACIPEECFYSEYDEDTLSEIMEEQLKMVRLLKSKGKSKHLANRILFIFGINLLISYDLVGSSLFSGKKDNPFKKLNTNHRHYSASLLMVTQYFLISNIEPTKVMKF